jgi:hypothetical protein
MWDPIDDSECVLGDVKLLFCADIEDGYQVAVTEAQKMKWKFSGERPHFLILSIRHVMLAHVKYPLHIVYSSPEPLFPGNGGLMTQKALDYLLHAIENARLYIPTRLQNLPLEIQDCILEQCCAVGIRSGQLGCLLGIGSLFNWRYRGKIILWLLTDSYQRADLLPLSHLLISPMQCALMHRCL